MSPLYLYEGQLLVKNGGLAANSQCCCRPCTYCVADNPANFYRVYAAPVNSGNLPLAATGAKKAYDRCAGIIIFELYTGNVKDRFQAVGDSGEILFDTGCVQCGGSLNTPPVATCTFTFCKPAGVLNIDMVHIPCGGTVTGWGYRVSNCIMGPC